MEVMRKNVFFYIKVVCKSEPKNVRSKLVDRAKDSLNYLFTFVRRNDAYMYGIEQFTKMLFGCSTYMYDVRVYFILKLIMYRTVHTAHNFKGMSFPYDEHSKSGLIKKYLAESDSTHELQ